MSITKNYRQTPYGDEYTITYEEQDDGTWEAHCSDHPDNPYSEDVEKCHLYSSGKICIRAGHEARTYDRIKAIVAAWIDGYSEYIRTGVFSKRKRAYNV